MGAVRAFSGGTNAEHFKRLIFLLFRKTKEKDKCKNVALQSRSSTHQAYAKFADIHCCRYLFDLLAFFEASERRLFVKTQHYNNHKIK